MIAERRYPLYQHHDRTRPPTAATIAAVIAEHSTRLDETPTAISVSTISITEVIATEAIQNTQLLWTTISQITR